MVKYFEEIDFSLESFISMRTKQQIPQKNVNLRMKIAETLTSTVHAEEEIKDSEIERIHDEFNTFAILY